MDIVASLVAAAFGIVCFTQVIRSLRSGVLKGRVAPIHRARQPIGFFVGITNKHRSSWCVANVADNPVAALAPPIRKILPAHGFGVLGETACEVGSLCRHERTPGRRRPAA